jgi:hypothetical protein
MKRDQPRCMQGMRSWVSTMPWVHCSIAENLTSSSTTRTTLGESPGVTDCIYGA